MKKKTSHDGLARNGQGCNLRQESIPYPLHFRPRLAALAFTGTLLFATSLASAATLSLGVHAASGTINIPGPTQDDSTSGSVPASRSVSSMQIETTPPGSSSASGQGSSSAAAAVALGGIHLLATSDASITSTKGGGMSASGGSSAWGSLTDTFVMQASCSSPSLCSAGTHGTMTFSIGVNGSATGSGTYTTSTPSGGNGGWSGSASWDNSGSVNAGWVPGASVATSTSWLRGESFATSQSGIVNSTTTGAGLGSESFTLEFIFGQAITFNMLGHVYSTANATYDYYASQGGSSATSSFAADMSHTMAWGGISELRDAQGNLLSDFSAVSASSGYDYRYAYAVPEPSVSAMMGAGLLITLAWKRRQTRRTGTHLG